MDRKKASVAGILLRMERLRQEKGQKEVCHGICVPSYLSKIEHGTVAPDEAILGQLCSRLGVHYERDEAIRSLCREKTQEYFYRLSYGLDKRAVYGELAGRAEALEFGEFTIDWLLIQGMEAVWENQGAKCSGIMERLLALEEGMDEKQEGWYQILRCSRMQHTTPGNGVENAQRKAAMVAAAKKACDRLGNAFALQEYCSACLFAGNYAAIHQMESRMMALAVEEGNTYCLAGYFFYKGSAYACLNLEELMMDSYERSMRLLQNTGWEEMRSTLNYNIGATLISQRKYDEALRYLDQVSPPDFPLEQKKALAWIRKGCPDRAQEFLEKAEKLLLEADSPLQSDQLKLAEARFECREGFLDNPEYLELLEKLLKALEKESHFGHLYFYQDMMIAACRRQRRYKQALEFQQQLTASAVRLGSGAGAER